MNNELLDSIAEVSKFVGKPIKSIEMVYSNGEDFFISHAYEARVIKLKMIIGSMCMDQPRALVKQGGPITHIAKWQNISVKDYQKMDGMVLCADNREGTEAAIVLFKE